MTERYVESTLTTKSFLPYGKFVNGMGEIAELCEEVMYITYKDKEREVLAAMPAKQVLGCCPLCKSDIQDGSVVVITDTHSLFPCWECEQLVEQENTGDVRDE
ncbi:MAG: hypothetical protein CMA09_03930 [Euryarchaeota archaeon]|nr:hypothetical protein [Euryarchaeota archaeon]|tara:strand:+ start:6571 stop:6879 length:309 start_codon:yes stop_codon:yes gene_type:complete